MLDYKKIIEDALTKVIAEEGYQGVSGNRDIHEQTLAHRLAFYLEVSGKFAGYRVDCEYNRQGADPKKDTSGLFKPDILIHVRGVNNLNLIMIETKKYNDRLEEINTAKEQLKSRSQLFNYSQAFIVIFPEKQIDENSVIMVKA